MMSPNLITCGDNVKIWDSNGYSLLHQFHPNNTKDDVVTDVSWSRDGGMVASVTSRQALLVVTGVTGEGTQELTVVKELAKPTCCRFCTSNSRYVCVGSHSGSVELWDNKNGKLVKHYQGHSAPVTRVCFSASDRHVASGSRSGQVLVHNVTSGFVTELPTARNEPQCVRDLRYSALSSAVVGAAFDTGHVSLWDVNQRRLLRTFTGGHVAPASGLAFSPVNDILVASVGLDKRLVCYDPKSKSIIQTLTGDAPLTAVDFHGDGMQLAVGTSQGRACVYDLRAPRRPSRSFTAHRSSVQRVQFQPPAKGQHRSSSSSVARESRSVGSAHEHSSRSTADEVATPVARPSSTSVAARVHSTPNEDGRTPPVAAGDSSHVRFGHVSAEQSSLFSPIREEPGQKATTPPQTDSTPNGTAHGGTSVHYGGRDSSVFSPMRGNISLSTGGAASSGAGPAESVVTPPDRPPAAATDNSLFSPLRPDRSLASDSAVEVVPPPAPLLNGLSVRDGESGVQPTTPVPSPRLNGVERSGPAPAAATRVTVAAEVCRGGRPGPDGAAPAPAPAPAPGGGGAAGDASSSSDRLLALLDGPADGEQRRDVLAELAFGGPAPAAAPRHQDGKGPTQPQQQQQTHPEPVPHSVVEKLEGLQEMMDDMWWGLRRENFNTQWTFGKHMYEMKTSLQGVVSTIETLKSEVERLREENQYLGCKF
ncbi:Protein NEDD1 [Amphibalanus amphitrite]|uniref:Protein NEDD1 n=1 Tax=Amphibalanus amphitrite TaxID=1232801 RepID=A0A6A4X2J2_AMPAM|nr:Protein NEDD1 [Amphibalanus amphitrite]